MVKLTLHVEEELRRAFKAKCAEDGQEMSAVIRVLIRKWLDDREKRSHK